MGNLKCSYREIQKAIKEAGAFRYTVAHKLGVSEKTLGRYMTYFPKLAEQLRKGKKRAAHRISEAVMKNLLDLLTDPSPEKVQAAMMHPTIAKLLMRLLANVDKEYWGVSANGKGGNTTTINNVSVTNNELPTLPDEKIKSILDKVKKNKQPVPEVIDNAPPALPYNSGGGTDGEKT